MPPRGWVSLSLRAEVMERLREFMEREGIVSPSDAVKMLLDRYALLTQSVTTDRVGKEAASRTTDPVSKEPQGGRRMTGRQRSYIWRLARKAMAKHQLTMAELKERAREELGVDIDEDMSREDASKVIEWLKELAGEED